jgi:hypothetical protein
MYTGRMKLWPLKVDELIAIMVFVATWALAYIDSSTFAFVHTLSGFYLLASLLIHKFWSLNLAYTIKK